MCHLDPANMHDCLIKIGQQARPVTRLAGPSKGRPCAVSRRRPPTGRIDTIQLTGEYDLWSFLGDKGERRGVAEVVMSAGTVVNAVFADWRGSPFERGELGHKPRMVEDADAAGSELRQHVQIDRGAVPIRMLISDARLGERVDYLLPRMLVADGSGKAISLQYSFNTPAISATAAVELKGGLISNRQSKQGEGRVSDHRRFSRRDRHLGVKQLQPQHCACGAADEQLLREGRGPPTCATSSASQRRRNFPSFERPSMASPMTPRQSARQWA